MRLRSRMGLLKGIARVNGQSVVEGTMTFALGPAVGLTKADALHRIAPAMLTGESCTDELAALN